MGHRWEEEEEEEEEENKNALAAAMAAAAAGSNAIVVEEDEKDEDDRRGMDDGAESAVGAGASCRLRFFGSFFSFFISFPFLPPALLLLLLLLLLLPDDDPDSLLAPLAPPRPSRKLLFPSQSGSEIQPSSRYVLSGWDGMFEGRSPALHQPFHSSQLFSLSFRTIALAAAKESMLMCCAWIGVFSLPSQSGIEIQPSSRYILCGVDGMFEGRFPALHHAFHPFSPFSLSLRTIALATAKGSMSSLFATTRPSLPSQSGHEIQPSSR